jgi:sulfonate transport system substrate-binding protein
MAGHTNGRLSRRRMLRLALGLPSAAALLAACGAPSATAPAAETSSSALSATTVATSAAPAATGAAANAPTLRLGFQPPYIAVFALQQQGLLEQAFGNSDTNIELRRLLSLNPIVEALSGGSLDLGMGGTPLGAIASGQPITVLALIERSPKTHAILTPPDSPITSPADLKGKKLGNPIGQAYIFPQRVLQQAGLAPSDVEWVKVENNEGRAALLTGGIDAWATWDPFYASAEAEQQAVTLVDGEGYHTNYVTLFGHSDYVQQYPDAVKRFIQSYAQALSWVQNNRQAAIELFVTENQLTPQVAELTFGRRNYQLTPPNDEYLADVTDQGKLLKSLQVIQQEPDWDSVVNTTLAAEALAS